MLPVDDSGWLTFFNKLYIWATLLAIVSGAIALMASNGIRIYSDRIAKVLNKQIAEADERAGKANQKAGDANKSAGEAHERAAKLEARASDAEARAKQAESEIAKANAESSDANRRAREAEARIADADAAAKDAVAKVASAEARIAEANALAAQANLELERMRTPRSISAERHADLVRMLTPFAGTPYVLAVSPESESINFMTTLQSLLSLSKWTQVDFSTGVILNNSKPQVGVSADTGVALEIAFAKLDEWGTAVEALMAGLKAAGIETRANAARTGVEPNAIHINIGKKP